MTQCGEIRIGCSGWLYRHWRELFYPAGQARGVSFCVHDMAGSATEGWAAGPVAYLRFHGGVGKYWGRYSDEALLSWADWMVAQARAGRDVWCYFNNDIGGAAIEDALTLRAMVAQAKR